MVLALSSLLDEHETTDVVLSVLEDYARSASVNHVELGRIIDQYALKFSIEELHVAYEHCEIGMETQFRNGFPGLAVDYINGMNLFASYIARMNSPEDDVIYFPGKHFDFDSRINDGDSTKLRVKKLLVQGHQYLFIGPFDCAASLIKQYVRDELDLPAHLRHLYKGNVSTAKKLESLWAVSSKEFTCNR